MDYGAMFRTRRYRGRLTAAIALIGIAAACKSPVRTSTGQASLTARVAAAVSTYSSRVALSADGMLPCNGKPEPIGVIATLGCEGSSKQAVPSRAVLTLADSISHEVETHPTPDALHAAALLDLGVADTTAESTERAVNYLRAATLLGDTTAATRADLSAALLVRGGRYASAHDIVEALDAATAAIEAAPANRAARFNVAIALSELGLADEARMAWAAYLGVDSTSPWAARARFYLSDASRVVRDSSNQWSLGARASFDSLARVDAQRARVVGWDTLLVTWANAVLA
ncbi:MAG: hypothetical protein ACREND_01090, partial [Gemmatimonadaceae bacterium]